MSTMINPFIPTKEPARMPIFVQKKTGSDEGPIASYVNIDDIAYINKVGDNLWEAGSKSGKNQQNQNATYAFDDAAAAKILNFVI